MQIFYLYILTNKYNNVLYTGMTNDIVRRVLEHKSRAAKGFTCKYNCDRLLWFEEHLDLAEALTRERLIKRWPRAWKDQMVEAKNPHWEDLAVDW